MKPPTAHLQVLLAFWLSWTGVTDAARSTTTTGTTTITRTVYTAPGQPVRIIPTFRKRRIVVTRQIALLYFTWDAPTTMGCPSRGIPLQAMDPSEIDHYEVVINGTAHNVGNVLSIGLGSLVRGAGDYMVKVLAVDIYGQRGYDSKETKHISIDSLGNQTLVETIATTGGNVCR